jgi:hypothetical protein
MINVILPLGSGFSGTVASNVTKSISRATEMEFLQGGAVDLGSYYETQVRRLERLKKKAPNVGLQQQNTIRNVSQISFGDNYYYTGRHMFSTTSKESYGPESLAIAGRHATAQSASIPFAFDSTPQSDPSVSFTPSA